MRKGVCPKCGSTEIYHCYDPKHGGGIGWGDYPNYIRFTSKWGSDGTKGFETFICANCGYFENYIIDREVLDKSIKDPANRWTKVNL